MVLKDGKIVEQGTHRELLAKDGVFAEMWANQISAEDPALSITDASMTKKEEDAIVGYDVNTTATVQPSRIHAADVIDDNDSQKLVDLEQNDDEGVKDSNRDGAPVLVNNEISSESAATEAFHQAPGIHTEELAPINTLEESNTNTLLAPTSYAAVTAVPPADKSAVVQQVPGVQPIPNTKVIPNAPIAFPTTGYDTASQRTASVADVSVTASVEGGGAGAQTTRPTSPPPGPSVTFGAGVNTPPRGGTPDQGGSGSEPSKRKRISSQNFQRFARRISIGQMMGPKRSGSSNSVQTGSGNTAAPVKSDEGLSGGRISIGDRTRSESRMSVGRGESPASSVIGVGDEDSKKAKKEKDKDKDKKRKGSTSTGK